MVLVDGSAHQIDRIRAEAKKRGVKVTIVVDFIHVMEYVWKAAWTFFAPGDADAEEWVAAQARKILAGKAREMAAGSRRRATRLGFSTAERKGADACATYLTNKKDLPGLPRRVGTRVADRTGVIEGACRHLVKDRMDLTGARWGLQGAEAVLKLRAVYANGDFTAYWAFHLQREHERIHQDRYQRYHEDFDLAS